MPPAADTLVIVTGAAALAEALREKILNGVIPAGEHLPEVQLAGHYRVGRYTVRAALASLANEGLVVSEANRGSRVVVLTARDIGDLFDLRILLEVAATRLALRHRADWTDLERVVQELERLPDDASWRRVVDLDLEFHQMLVATSGSDRMRRAYATVLAEVRLSLTSQRVHYNTASQLAAEHRQLIDALARGDVRRALTGLRGHLDSARQLLLRSFSDPSHRQPA